MKPALNHQEERSEGYYHPGFSAHAVKVLLGEHKISQRADEMLVTTLGSCIAACIRDPVLQLGGMNHFLLTKGPPPQPATAASRWSALSTRSCGAAAGATGWK
jgi:chemotaxis protein CheD